MAGRLGRGRPLRGAPRRPAQILRIGDVSLPVGQSPYRPCAQLRDGRRDRALQDVPRLQRVAPVRMGRVRDAGGERRDGLGRAPEGLDLSQHRRDARADEAARPLHRLVARVRHLRSRVLRPAAGALSRHARRRAGLSQARDRELGSGRHDGPGQRAGHRRQGLALGRGCRAARADAMGLRDLLDGRGAARRPGHARRLARQGAPYAGELDRQVARVADELPAERARPWSGRDRRLHDPARYAARRLLHRHRPRASARKGVGRRGRSAGRLRRRHSPGRHHRGRAWRRRRSAATTPA